MLAVSERVLFAAEEYKPEVIVQTPENVFTPQGFDDNDNVQIVLYGNLPDTCHKIGPAYTKVDKEHKTIYVKNTAYYYPGCFCADVLVPYLTTVNVGILKTGGYEVVVERADGSFDKAANLPISVATSASPDDFIYAPVEHMHFVAQHRENVPQVILSGIFRSTCMTLKDIKVNYRANHVIEIQPIAEVEKSGCLNDARLFQATVRLKANLRGRALLHVRSLNGQSINQVVDL
jgi:hypothetical protein